MEGSERLGGGTRVVGSDPIGAEPGATGSDPTGGARGLASTRNKRLWVLNLLLFQLGWWALVLSAARGYPGLGLAVVAAILAWHLGFVRPLASEALLIGLAALIGLTFDSLLIATGWVSYGPPAAVAAQALGVATHPVLASASFPTTSTGASLTATLPPLWMMALWANFATTLNLSLAGLQIRPWLAALLGLVGGPLAYSGGAGLGAMSFVSPLPALIALALGWALLTPLLLTLAATLARRSNP